MKIRQASVLFLATLVLGLSAPAQIEPGTRVDAGEPLPKRANARFYELHAQFLKRAKEPMQLLFLGDSITERWATVPEIWNKYYGAWQPANFGVGGDWTQHVLWRIADGELDGVHPKVVVFLLGTNNTGQHGGEEIAAADAKIVKQIQEKIPGVKVLLLAIFPRALRPNIPVERQGDTAKRVAAIAAANRQLAALANGTSIRYLDLGPKFLTPDGKIPLEIMPDQLHLSPKGYQIWAEAMQPLLEEMMN